MTAVKVALNVTEAAAAVGVSTKTIDRAIAAGTLRAKRSGAKLDDSGKPTGDGTGLRLIAPDDLRAWFEGLPDA